MLESNPVRTTDNNLQETVNQYAWNRPASFTQSEFKILNSVVYTLERKDKKSLRDFIDQNAKVTFH